MKKRPHIIIFNPDQMQNAALAHMGENPAAQTPFLDSLANSEAVSYRNAFCQNPVCVPSRCSFLTGLYPHVNGHRTMNHMLHSHESSILKELKENGYYVWMNARNDFLPGQEEGSFEAHADETFYGGNVPPAPGPVISNMRGEPGSKHYYSHYLGTMQTDVSGIRYSNDDEIVDAAVHRVKNPVDDRPLCMFIGLINPHPDYGVEEPYFSAIDRMKLPERVKERAPGSFEPKIEAMIRQRQGLENFTEEDWDELRACYLGMCLKVDALFEKFCDGLKEAGIYDDCAIFFFSDHGDYQGQFGLSEKNQNTFYEGLVRVPFLIKPPKGYDIDPGVNDNIVELIDFYATAMSMAGVTPDHTHFGIDLTDSIADRNHKTREFACCEGGRLRNEIHCDESHEVGVFGIGPGNSYYPRVKSQEDPVAHTKATMLRTDKYKYVRRLYEEDQLYDIQNDPGETRSLADDESYASVLNELRRKMLTWYQETCDIVPFKLDSRFNYEMTWNRVKNICPPENVEEVQELIRKGSKSMFEMIRYCTSLHNADKAGTDRRSTDE